MKQIQCGFRQEIGKNDTTRKGATNIFGIIGHVAWMRFESVEREFEPGKRPCSLFLCHQRDLAHRRPPPLTRCLSPREG